MKKLLFVLIVVITATSLSAQSLESIVNKHKDAVGAKTLMGFKTIAIEAQMEQMGMIMELKMYEKAPDKIKVLTSVNGMEMIQVVNGDRGYMVNPMMGSTDPVPLPAEQLAQMKNNGMLKNTLGEQLKAGKLELVGEEDIDGSPAYKIKSLSEAGEMIFFVDKKSYYVTSTNMSVNQGGIDMDIMMKMSNFEKIKGVTFARKIDTYMGGQMLGSLSYNTIEFDKAIDDSEFEIK